jgi:hypothetical protein
MTFSILAIIAVQTFTMSSTAASIMTNKPVEIVQKQISKMDSEKPTVMEMLNNGKYIRLTDNTLWEIHEKDTPITQSWISPVEIYAAPSGDKNYPYTLTNSLTGSKVRARKVSRTLKTAPSAQS